MNLGAWAKVGWGEEGIETMSGPARYQPPVLKAKCDELIKPAPHKAHVKDVPGASIMLPLSCAIAQRVAAHKATGALSRRRLPSSVATKFPLFRRTCWLVATG